MWMVIMKKTGRELLSNLMAECITDTHVVMTNNTHPLSKIPYAVLRNRFDDKVETLRKTYGLKVEVMLECEWKRIKLDHPAAVAFMGRYTHLKQLMPRESLFGRRTKAVLQSYRG